MQKMKNEQSLMVKITAHFLKSALFLNIPKDFNTNLMVVKCMDTPGFL